MAKYAGSDVGILLIDGYDLRPYAQELAEDGISAVLEDTSVFGDTWEAKDYTGIKLGGGFNLKGFLDGAALASIAALITNEGVSRVCAYGVEGNTLGKRVVCMGAALEQGSGRMVPLKAFQKISAKFAASGIVDTEALVHTPLGALSGASGDGTAVDNAASSANGGRGYFFVKALTLGGYTNLALKVRHSADDITYADKATATVVTAAPTGELVTVTGTVNRYTRSNWAYNGAGAGQSATAMIAFARG